MIKDFWEGKHSTNNLASLSGHPGRTVLNGLYIQKDPPTGSEVLEIGVGLGYCTKDLVELGYRVSVVDISENALARVRDITQRQFLETQLQDLPDNTFDLAVSYCVVQHINNQSLTLQLRNVVRSLTPTGYYAMQYAIPYHNAPLVETEEALAGGSVVRTPDMLFDMVEAAGGEIIYHRIWGYFPQYKSGWAIAHIKRKV